MIREVVAVLLTALLALTTPSALAEKFDYKNIAKRNPDVKLSDKAVRSAKMEGECLLGLKQLNFKKKDKFDAVAEWTNYRSISLLQHYSPCSVLVIMEVAKSRLDSQIQTTGKQE